MLIEIYKLKERHILKQYSISIEKHSFNKYTIYLVLLERKKKYLLIKIYKKKLKTLTLIKIFNKKKKEEII